MWLSATNKSYRAVPILAAVLVGVTVLAVVYAQTLISAHDAIKATSPAGSAQLEGEQAEPTVVTLSEQKLTAAHLKLEPAALRTLTHSQSVPGRIVYDENRQIDVKSPVDGILTRINVKPGDVLSAGDVLASIVSPEIGEARADLLERSAQTRLSQALAERAATLQRNVTALVAALKEEPPFDALKEFTGELLGSYRDSLFGAYARMQLAESLLKDTAPLGETGALSGAVLRERQTQARAARATLESLCEQAGMDVWQQHQQAAAASHDAQLRLEIAREHLAAMLGDASANRAAPPKDSEQDTDNHLNALSNVDVRAPMGGTIESRLFSARERVQRGDTLFVLANTQSLWIKAELREGDWPALSISAGQMLQVSIPALRDAKFTATVEFVGREISPESNAIPIVASIDNSQGQLRPGLFARVSVPTGVRNDVLTVPVSAVLQYDGRSFVFIPHSANQFRRVDVRTGEADAEHIEIVSGLHTGQQVVAEGAFVLKSELLLESTEE